MAVVEWGDVAGRPLGHAPALTVRLATVAGAEDDGLVTVVGGGRRADAGRLRLRHAGGSAPTGCGRGGLSTVLVLAVESATDPAGVALADEAGRCGGIDHGRRAGATARRSPRPSRRCAAGWA